MKRQGQRKNELRKKEAKMKMTEKMIALEKVLKETRNSDKVIEIIVVRYA
jgi:mannose/cellobiose epimerase-like protein (N-acyl-D-glucosamine 2-epimerase family)